jgi:formylglycine-generating enzyme required for sulfatase activity
MRASPLLLALCLGLCTARPAAADPVRPEMARIPGGRYVPLFVHHPGPVKVDAFALDRLPVTRGEYLTFVTALPAWRRDRVGRAFAGPGYLAGWPSAASAGSARDLRLPATEVSWPAARAYCAWRGKRLPTTDEWEFAALASERSRDASRDPAFTARLLRLYTSRAARPVGSTFRNAYGVSDLHGLVWEWTLDFDGTMPSHASHANGGQGHVLSCAAGSVGTTDPANYPAFLRYGFRSALNGRTTTEGLGFRCAQDL